MDGSAPTDRIGYLTEFGGGAMAVLPPDRSILAATSSGSASMFVGFSITTLF